MSDKKRIFGITLGAYKGAELVALFVLIYLVLNNYLISKLSDVVWILSILIAYFALNSYSQIQTNREIAKEFERLNAEIKDLKKSIAQDY